MHSMNFVYSMCLLTIYGGKYETDNYTKFYDDLYILNLKNLEWMVVEVYGEKKTPRAMHQSYINQKNMIIFGGQNDMGYLKGNVEILELDQKVVRKMKNMQNFKQEIQINEKQNFKNNDSAINSNSKIQKSKILEPFKNSINDTI